MEQKIRGIQQKLSELQHDRTRYFTVPIIMELYLEFKSILDAIPEEEADRLKTVISDCLLILSLGFNTVGFTRQPVAIYAKALTLQILFKFIRRDPAFTPKELGVLKSSIRSVSESLSEEGQAGIPEIQYVNRTVSDIIADLNTCSEYSTEVMNTLPEEEYPLYSQITHMRRYFLAEISGEEFSPLRFESLKSKLERAQAHIEQECKNTTSDTNSEIKYGSPLLRYQIHKAAILLDLFNDKVSLLEMEKEDKDLCEVYENLQEILPVLDVFIMTRRWTLRVTDLFQHMKALLHMIPLLLVGDGVVVYSAHEDIPLPVDRAHKCRYLLTYMARRAWALIFKLLDTTEPVSEALYSLYNQLLTMKRCLKEVQLAGGISNLRELYPYQMRLASLDNQRVDGKFVVGDEVPPGQGVLNGMLAECFDLVYELKVELEEKSEDDTNIVDDDVNSSGDCESDEAGEFDTFDEGSIASSDISSKKSLGPHDVDDHLADVPEANE